jgi:two-component system, OmpR family, heavy metal sensor histidine kinase CusS
MILGGRRSITLRLTLLFAAVSTTVLLVLGLLVGVLVEDHFEDLDMELLGGKLELVRHALAGVAAQDDLARLPGQLDAALVGHHGLSVRIWSGDGAILYASALAGFSPETAHAPEIGGPVRRSGRDGKTLRILTGEAAVNLPGSRPAVVEVATDLAHHEMFMASFRTALWTTVGLAALASGLLGWAVARRGLAPLRDISRDAASITANRLDRRLPSEAIPEELAEVARTLNAMLARLEESFRKLSDFSSDLAHELRTPLSNLLTETQVTLAKARTAGEYEDVLVSNAEELERLARTISDMLFLAKADNDLAVPNPEPVDLREQVEGLLSFYEALAEESGVRLAVEGRATVRGDPLMLRRAIGNLLSNALRHTPRGGRVAVRLAGLGEGTATVAVENTGETIPPEHLPRLFDRFYRVDPARRQSEGAGLGLAITRSIVRAHGGEVSVRSAGGLTTFELVLPGGEAERGVSS